MNLLVSSSPRWWLVSVGLEYQQLSTWPNENWFCIFVCHSCNNVFYFLFETVEFCSDCIHMCVWYRFNWFCPYTHYTSTTPYEFNYLQRAAQKSWCRAEHKMMRSPCLATFQVPAIIHYIHYKFILDTFGNYNNIMDYNYHITITHSAQSYLMIFSFCLFDCLFNFHIIDIGFFCGHPQHTYLENIWEKWKDGITSII